MKQNSSVKAKFLLELRLSITGILLMNACNLIPQMEVTVEPGIKQRI